MSRPDFKARFLVLLQFIRAARVGLGYRALGSAVGLALWGWLIAKQSDFEGRWDPFDWIHGYHWRNAFPVPDSR